MVRVRVSIHRVDRADEPRVSTGRRPSPSVERPSRVMKRSGELVGRESEVDSLECQGRELAIDAMRRDDRAVESVDHGNEGIREADGRGSRTMSGRIRSRKHDNELDQRVRSAHERARESSARISRSSTVPTLSPQRRRNMRSALASSRRCPGHESRAR